MSDESKKTVFRRAVVTEEEKKKYLVGNTPPFLGKPIELGLKDLTIGREEGRDLQLPSEMVSRLHATVSKSDERFVLVDHDSANGTFLNNLKMSPNEPHALNHKDVVRFDTFEFLYVDSAVSDLWETLKPLAREGSQIITLYSPKGGTGVTSLAVNLAHLLSQGGKKSVAIADFDLRFGDVLTYSLGKPGLSIYELTKEVDITGENIAKYLHKCPSYSYLPTPTKMEYAELIRPEHAKKVLWSLESKFDTVIVDLKNEIDDFTITAWELATLILVVGHPEIGHMLALRKILDVMAQFKYPDSKVKVLINRLGREGTLSQDEIKTFLKREFYHLPDCPAEAVHTSHSGQLYVQSNPGSILARGLENLYRGIQGEEVMVQEGGIFATLKNLLGF
jgi:MinD-like ATPase involved in chromosome partitioning or flagellar assembly